MRREIFYSKWPSNALLITQTTVKYQAFHFNTLEYFAAKGAIYYVTKATMIFPRVRITCFRAKAHLRLSH